MIIDFSSHYIAGGSAKIFGKGQFYGDGKFIEYPLQNANVETRLGLMEKYGVDVQALSQTAPVLLGFNAEDAGAICRASNDDNFKLCKAYPDKFVNVAILSLLDVKGAIKELERSVKDLDARGVTLAANQAGKGLDSAEYYPLYKKLLEYDLPVFLQPTNWENYPLMDVSQGWRTLFVFGWPLDTTQAIWRLILSGTIDRFPDLKIVTHHCGAMFPFFARRAEGNYKIILNDKRMAGNKLNKDFWYYWKNIYGDTALDGTVAAYMCGYAMFGADRMVYGTDYPFGLESGEDFYRENMAGVKAMKITAAEKKKILGENAKKLFKIK